MAKEINEGLKPIMQKVSKFRETWRLVAVVMKNYQKIVNLTSWPCFLGIKIQEDERNVIGNTLVTISGDDTIIYDYVIMVHQDFGICLLEPWPTINIRPHIMHFRRLVFSYAE